MEASWKLKSSLNAVEPKQVHWCLCICSKICDKDIQPNDHTDLLLGLIEQACKLGVWQEPYYLGSDFQNAPAWHWLRTALGNIAFYLIIAAHNVPSAIKNTDRNQLDHTEAWERRIFLFKSVYWTGSVAQIHICCYKLKKSCWTWLRGNV